MAAHLRLPTPTPCPPHVPDSATPPQKVALPDTSGTNVPLTELLQPQMAAVLPQVVGGLIGSGESRGAERIGPRISVQNPLYPGICASDLMVGGATGAGLPLWPGQGPVAVEIPHR